MEVLVIIAIIWVLCALAAGCLEQAPRKPYQPPRKGK